MVSRVFRLKYRTYIVNRGKLSGLIIFCISESEALIISNITIIFTNLNP